MTAPTDPLSLGDGSRGELAAPTLSERLLDDGSDWFNLACTRIVAVALVFLALIYLETFL